MQFTDQRVSFNFQIEPYPYRRQRESLVHGRIHRYPHPETDKFEREIARLANAQRLQSGYQELEGRLALESAFYVSNRRSDVDNYGKALLDGLTKVFKLHGARLFHDDSQFDWLLFRRFFVPKGHEGIQTTITGITDNGYKKLDFEGPF